MYVQMQNWGDLQVLLDGGDGVPNWEVGTTFPNSFATVAYLGSLQIYAPLPNAEGKRVFRLIYEQPDVEEELAAGIGQGEKNLDEPRPDGLRHLPPWPRALVDRRTRVRPGGPGGVVAPRGPATEEPSFDAGETGPRLSFD